MIRMPADHVAGGVSGRVDEVDVQIKSRQVQGATLAVIEDCSEVLVTLHAVSKGAAIEFGLIGLQRQHCRFHAADVHFQLAIAANAA